MNTLSLRLPIDRLGARVGTGFGHAVTTMLGRWKHARKVAETQRYLAQMDDHMLADLGVSRAQAGFELERAMRWSIKE